MSLVASQNPSTSLLPLKSVCSRHILLSNNSLVGRGKMLFRNQPQNITSFAWGLLNCVLKDETILVGRRTLLRVKLIEVRSIRWMGSHGSSCCCCCSNTSDDGKRQVPNPPSWKSQKDIIEVRVKLFHSFRGSSILVFALGQVFSARIKVFE